MGPGVGAGVGAAKGVGEGAAEGAEVGTTRCGRSRGRNHQVQVPTPLSELAPSATNGNMCLVQKIKPKTGLGRWIMVDGMFRMSA